MERIESLLTKKKEIAAAYSKGLAEIPGIQLPPQMSWAGNVYWLYSIIIEPEVFGCTRDELMIHLKQANIETRPLFPPIHQQPIYNTGQSLPIAERLSANGLSLPSAVTLKLEDVDRIVEAIKKASCNR
jgi:perosamine synthetase